jgi:hypothetical protein
VCAIAVIISFQNTQIPPGCVDPGRHDKFRVLPRKRDAAWRVPA